MDRELQMYMHDKLPLRYFCELLHQNKRLIFTGKSKFLIFNVNIVLGFSVGALLARKIMIKLWNLPYFSAEMLLRNVACIVFGYPIFREIVAQFAIGCEQKSCHTFQIENDLHSGLFEQFSQNVSLCRKLFHKCI